MCDAIVHNIQSSAQSAWNAIQEAAQNVGSACSFAAQEAGKGIYSGYTWAGRSVEHLVHNSFLPEPAAKIISSTFWALPYTATSLLLPWFIRDIANAILFGVWRAFGRELDEAMGKDNRQHLYTGIRNASIIQVGIDTAMLIATGDWFLLLPIISNLYFALQGHAVANEPTPEPKPEQKPNPPNNSDPAAPQPVST